MSARRIFSISTLGIAVLSVAGWGRESNRQVRIGMCRARGLAWAGPSGDFCPVPRPILVDSATWSTHPVVLWRTDDVRHRVQETAVDMTRSSDGEGVGDSTSMFRADLIGDEPSPHQPPGVPDGVEGLPSRFGLIVVRRGPNAGARFLLDHAISSVGRHPDSDIFLDDPSVSRRHAEIRHEGARFLVADVGSLNGTYLNRVLIDSADLTDGDEIQVGKFRLVFRGSS